MQRHGVRHRDAEDGDRRDDGAAVTEARVEGSVRRVPHEIRSRRGSRAGDDDPAIRLNRQPELARVVDRRRDATAATERRVQAAVRQVTDQKQSRPRAEAVRGDNDLPVGCIATALGVSLAPRSVVVTPPSPKLASSRPSGCKRISVTSRPPAAATILPSGWTVTAFRISASTDGRTTPFAPNDGSSCPGAAAAPIASAAAPRAAARPAAIVLHIIISITPCQSFVQTASAAARPVQGSFRVLMRR
jgi:hypothetical protein